MSATPHLWLALSPHGYGHTAMTAPVIAEIQRRIPSLRLTIQTQVDPDFLRSRYRHFSHVDQIADFGFHMVSATGIDLEASAQGYLDLFNRFDVEVADNAARMALDRPHLVLSNVAFIPLAAAARLGVPALALSSLNWADMYAHYLGHRPEAPRVLEKLLSAYHGAQAFLRCTPGQAMSLTNQVQIGPIARIGQDRRAEMRRNLGLAGADRVGLIAFGGIGHDLDLTHWPAVPGWSWLVVADDVARPDMVHWRRSGLHFSDLIASVDVVVTKPGYGTFTEAAMVGTPVLYTSRPDWPESPHLDDWLARHTQALATQHDALMGDLAGLLQKLFSLPKQQVATPDGVAEAAEIIVAELERHCAIDICS
ncbi:conserved protein of unknown function [Magnetospirillum gryphiswaldense MSR-1 v2]|uniref:Glycosyl transferase family 28 C-terminal domain-containing protein n=1 Tax=Magnetospirillum gryphiswaldense (strain DSM 6361 / JCM 21280 / NBRC 15271 / MSR-1) TaxID=431944 RepID=V6EYN8_MAGGM|nr:hypothetical protein [Magnetospirillum gryphiswaldense]CDK98370.1 conserved protein of unknown function [Magnetospirillum gryphiswaldense MSR-1 v2]